MDLSSGPIGSMWEEDQPQPHRHTRSPGEEASSSGVKPQRESEGWSWPTLDRCPEQRRSWSCRASPPSYPYLGPARPKRHFRLRGKPPGQKPSLMTEMFHEGLSCATGRLTACPPPDAPNQQKAPRVGLECHLRRPPGSCWRRPGPRQQQLPVAADPPGPWSSPCLWPHVSVTVLIASYPCNPRFRHFTEKEQGELKFRVKGRGSGHLCALELPGFCPVITGHGMWRLPCYAWCKVSSR